MIDIMIKTKIERSLTREVESLRGKIERKKIHKELGLIARTLDGMERDSFGSYKLRNVRYRLLKARGIKANRTYPRYNSELCDNVDAGLGVSKWTPVTFRFIN